MSETVRKLMKKTEGNKMSWEKGWEEKQMSLKRRLETCQIMVEKNQIDRDLDLLLNEIEHRAQNLGHNLEQAQHCLLNFYDITDNLNVRD